MKKIRRLAWHLLDDHNGDLIMAAWVVGWFAVGVLVFGLWVLKRTS